MELLKKEKIIKYYLVCLLLFGMLISYLSYIPAFNHFIVWLGCCEEKENIL